MALVPVLLGRLTAGQLLAVSTGAVAFLAFVSVVSLRASQALRLLQFRISAAERCSRHRLAAGGPEPYFGYTLTRDMPPLPDQKDPMGFVVASARLVVLVDIYALAFVGIAAASYAFVGDRLGDAADLAPVLVGGTAVGATLAAAWRIVIDQWLRRGERDVSTEVRDRLAAIGVPD